MSKVESEVRIQIDKRLAARGWILNPDSSRQDVFTERSVVKHLGAAQKKKLSNKSPDYTFFADGAPIAILEAKKPKVSIDDALDQAEDYAKRIDVKYVFACNGPTFKSRYVPTGEPMLLNNLEVTEPLSCEVLRKFARENKSGIFTLPKNVLTSRGELIDVFERLNDVLRKDGIRAGAPRFTEFANMLFLKLLSERDDSDTIWHDLTGKPASELPKYINNYVIGRLREKYGDEVVSKTEVSGVPLKRMVMELNPLNLSSVEEDVKAAAFEHFLGQTTASNNDLGEYFTPRQYIRFVLQMVNPQFGKTVYDPFCGTGGFLIQAFKHLSQQAKHSKSNAETLYQKSIYGQELTETARIAKMNMILFGDGHSGVEQRDSLSHESQDESKQYDYVLSNIPFSQELDADEARAVHPKAKDADEACLYHCFNKLKDGGAMGVILPEGLVFNRAHREMWDWIFANSRVRVIAALPRGAFAPYTDAGTRVLYLTDKGKASTDWYYDAVITGEKTLGASIDADKFLYFYQDADKPLETVSGVYVAKPEDGFIRSWNPPKNHKSVPLNQVAHIQKGKMLTKSKATPGDVPVIGGGAGVIVCTHNEANHDGQCFTISGSGAYSGHAWWHEEPIWASDCLVVRSRDESRFSTFYLYMCVKALQEDLYSRQHGTGQPHIYAQHVEGLPIPVLTLKRQRAMTGKVRDAIVARIEAERAERRIRGGAVYKFANLINN